MAVPADFTINYIPNPSVNSAYGTTGWTAANATIASATPPVLIDSNAMEVTSSAGGSMSVSTSGTGTSAMAVPASTSMVLWAACVTSATSRTVTASITWYDSTGTLISTSTGSGVSDVTGTYTTVSVVATSPSNAAYASVTFTWAGIAAAGEVHWIDEMILQQGSAVGTWVDGDSPADDKYRYFWSSTAGNSPTTARYRGVWVEAISGGSGAPGIQVYASGTGTSTADVTITRTADNETWTVPGWNERSIVDGDTTQDFACPLGRDVVYTLFINDSQINSMTINVSATTGWVQDPWDPSTAMPIETTLVTPTHLTLGQQALAQRTHTVNATRGQLMGSTRQYSLSGQRTMDDGCHFMMYAHQNDVSDAFHDLVKSTPILLFRPLPSWGSVPGLAYTDGSAVETPLNRQRIAGNAATTQWDVTGGLIQPVTRVPLVSTATYNQMATALNGTTYDTIQARSGSKKYIEIKANPLAL